MKFVEATITMPITILIVAAMITLTVSMFTNLQKQVEEHQEELKVVYEKSEALEVRTWDTLTGFVK